jgi:tetrahydromethanopterin S-methyltransferase subunit C
LTFYFKGKITGKMLAKRIGVAFISAGTGVLLSSAGMAVGIAIGTAICPVIGTIIGAIVGAIGAAYCNYKSMKLVEALVDKCVDTRRDEEFMVKENMYK